MNVSSDKQTLGEMSKSVSTFVLHPVCVCAKYLAYKVIIFLKKSLHAKKESSKITFKTTTVSAVPNHRFVV